MRVQRDRISLSPCLSNMNSKISQLLQLPLKPNGINKTKKLKTQVSL